MSLPDAREVNAIRLNEADNVLILIREGKKGETAKAGECAVPLAEDIPGGHKTALASIPKGGSVVKYGRPIGVATRDIAPGEHVHEHNTATRLDSAMPLPAWTPGKATSGPAANLNASPIAGTFYGYRRKSGRAGVRNDIWVIPVVGCINGELRALVREWEEEGKKPGWIDGVKILEHPFGCSQLGEDLTMTADLLAGLAQNPNAAGVLLAGLGCENLRLPMVLERLEGASHVRSLSLQADGENKVKPLLDELAYAAPRGREAFPISELCVGIKCGGSDGYSGLTANPLVGRFSDRLTASGGTVLATEIPEMFGAEEVVASRITDRATHDDFISMIRWFQDYFTNHGQPIYENPAPGNREGGITTLEEKSLGAVEKSGSSPVTHILKYGRPILDGGGVQITFAPGNDLVSCTSLAGSGAQIILFTTGRGTPFGSVVPTVKISTNSGLAKRHPNWIDFDAGTLLNGESWEDATERLTEYVLRVASGEMTKNERKNIGEIALFKDGVIL